MSNAPYIDTQSAPLLAESVDSMELFLIRDEHSLFTSGRSSPINIGPVFALACAAWALVAAIGLAILHL